MTDSVVVIGIGLVLVQVYLFVIAAPRADSAPGWVLLVMAAVVFVAQVVGIALLRRSAREWAIYPVTFAGLVVSSSLLAPLLVSTF